MSSSIVSGMRSLPPPVAEGVRGLRGLRRGGLLAMGRSEVMSSSSSVVVVMDPLDGDLPVAMVTEDDAYINLWFANLL